jgi:hypothetical protein
MDDAAIALAIAARLQAVTPPSGQSAIAWASHELLDSGTPPFPALELLPPEESIEWLPARQMRSTSEWTAQLLLDSGAELPVRMAALYAWRTAIRTQLAGQIQLGIAGVELAFLVGMRSPEDEFGQQLIDALELSIRVVVREVVPSISA